MVIKEIEEIEAPAEIIIEYIFTLRYRLRGVNTDTNFLAANKDEAIELGNKWCVKLRARFIWVQPFAVNLKELIEREELNS